MKKFLENNKIFFETIAATLIGIMAIIVSVSQSWVAYRTLTLDKLRYMPEIGASIVIDKNICGPKSWALRVSNSTGIAYHVSYHPIAFLYIHQLQVLQLGEKPNSSIHLKKTKLPLVGFFTDFEYDTSVTKGLIGTTCTNNLWAMDDVEHKFNKYGTSKDLSTTSYVIMFLKVNYEDQFMRRRTEYFRFTSGGQAVPITTQAGSTLFRKYREMKKSHESLQYGKSSARDILNLWRKLAV